MVKILPSLHFIWGVQRRFMYKCNYCTATFEKPTERGLCPACGGPNPKEVKASPPSVQAQAASLKAQVFRKVGYNPVSIVAQLATIAFIVLLVLAFVKPEMRKPLLETNLLLGLVLIGLNVLLNHWTAVAFAGIGFIIAFILR